MSNQDEHPPPSTLAPPNPRSGVGEPPPLEGQKCPLTPPPLGPKGVSFNPPPSLEMDRTYVEETLCLSEEEMATYGGRPLEALGPLASLAALGIRDHSAVDVTPRLLGGVSSVCPCHRCNRGGGKGGAAHPLSTKLPPPCPPLAPPVALGALPPKAGGGVERYPFWSGGGGG